MLTLAWTLFAISLLTVSFRAAAHLSMFEKVNEAKPPEVINATPTAPPMEPPLRGLKVSCIIP